MTAVTLTVLFCDYTTEISRIKILFYFMSSEFPQRIKSIHNKQWRGKLILNCVVMSAVTLVTAKHAEFSLECRFLDVLNPFMYHFPFK